MELEELNDATGDEYNNKSNGFIKRKRTRKSRVGNVFIGGDAPIGTVNDEY